MKIPRFEMERFQSTWEPTVEFNLADSGVHPLALSALADDAWIRESLSQEPLAYGHTNGSPELRSAIAAMHEPAAPAHVLVTSGTAEANFLVTLAVSVPGSEVVVMLPNYMQIPLLARAWGATVSEWWLRASTQWAPDPDELEGLVTTRTSAIFVCNPNNPTGAVLSQDGMDAICAAAARVGAWVVADEVYRGAELADVRTPSFWTRYPRVIVTGGLSKAYGLPGLRIGWVVAPPEFIEQLWGYHDYTTIAPSVLSDRIARLALTPAVHRRLATRTRQILVENLAIVRGWIGTMNELVSWIPPQAGAIAFVRYHRPINSTAFANQLRDEQSVLIVPGDHFRMDGYLRIGYGGQAAMVAEGLRRTGALLEVV